MAVIKIELDKPYDEFEVGGEVYKIYFDDESLRRYEKQVFRFQKEMRKNPDPDKLNKAQREALERNQLRVLREFIESFFGENSYDPIYEASGKSLINMSTVIKVLRDWLDQKMSIAKAEEKEYYTKQ